MPDLVEEVIGTGLAAARLHDRNAKVRQHDDQRLTPLGVAAARVRDHFQSSALSQLEIDYQNLEVAGVDGSLRIARAIDYLADPVQPRPLEQFRQAHLQER